MTTLSIDIETFSKIDLTKAGVYRYVEDPSFEILLFAYAFDSYPVEVLDLMDLPGLRPNIYHALQDPDVIKTAFNANFERTCLAKYLQHPLPPEQWQCTAVLASSLGLPLGLGDAAKALRLEQQKDNAGKALIKYFCAPCAPTKANGYRTRNLPEHAPDKWKQFIEYNRQDVIVERDIRDMLQPQLYKPPKWSEHKLWCLDQEINDRGAAISLDLMSQAMRGDALNTDRLVTEMALLTGLDNPNSPAQLKKWLEDVHGIALDSLNKEAVSEIIGLTDGDARRALEIRQETSKTSVKKYDAMARSVYSDDRIRGLFQFNGAGRTARWAGRGVQVQNLPKTGLSDIDLARELTLAGDFDTIDTLYGSLPDTLSQLIRTAFIPAPGHRFIVADFSAIEARILVWLAKEEWALEVFRTHGKIYEAAAANMYKIPIEAVTKAQRQKGKIGTLSLGYGGATGALEKMGALKMGLEESELQPLVNLWRRNNPKIVALWAEVEAAAFSALAGHRVSCAGWLRLAVDHGALTIQLPTGRKLVYHNPSIKTGKFGKPAIVYEGMNQTTHQWGRIDTYGPKLVENIIQGIARDCLADAMLRLDAAGYRIVMHIHDEVVLEMPEGQGSLEEACAIMGEELPWAPGLPLGAAGFEGKYYRKD